MWLYPLLLFPLVSTRSEHIRTVRQVSLDDIISGALSLVRPIFDTSKPLQKEGMLTKPVSPTQDDMRDSSILGSRGSTALDDLPFCKGNSGICQFISCSADNFKKDPTFGNIQLAAQVIGDEKLRKAISNNPDAVATVCKDQGMTDAQCKLFSKGFQLIDKFLTTVEEKDSPKTEKLKQTRPPATQQQQPQMDVLKTEENKREVPDYDDIKISGSKSEGSHTWSSNPIASDVPIGIPNEYISNWTPLPFVLPTIPTAPPLAFNTVPSVVVPKIQYPLLSNDLFFSTDKFGFLTAGNSITKRIKRAEDYYDQLEDSGKKPQNKPASSDDDYYGGIDESSFEKESDSQPGLKQCVHLLGLA